MEQSQAAAANLVPLSRMTFHRRWLLFSLRGLLALLTMFAIWSGAIANRAREQREATAAIHSIGGIVIYDWQFRDHGKVGPMWLRQIIGDDFFQKPVQVSFENLPPTPESDIVQVIPHLKRLRHLNSVFILAHISKDTKNALEAALPHCDIYQ